LPSAAFLVAAGDSSYLVESDTAGLRVRRSAMLLTEVEGRFHELYLTDDDRSYYDAVIIGQRIYSRDVERGDSLLLFSDTVLAQLADAYAARHPNEAPLAPDEEAAEEPAIHATTETELVEVSGPYLTVEQHVDIDVVGERDQHITRRRVIDLRDAQVVSVTTLLGEQEAGVVFREAERGLRAVLDSVRQANDERARRAATALTGFALDSLSFALLEEGGEPAIAFLVPGRGARAGGFALPLPPIRVTAGTWWKPARAGLPLLSPGTARWELGSLSVVAREDSSGESALLSIRAEPNEWVVARVPTPVTRLHPLQAPGSALVLALRRAFDEAALYSGETRTASHPRARHPSPIRTASASAGGSAAIPSSLRPF